MKRTDIIPALIIAILLFAAVPASASWLDDANSAIGNTIQKVAQTAKTLSLPGVGSITVRCNTGATCAQQGDNWVIAMTSMSNDQTIDMELQPGITSISGTSELTTGSSVTIEVTEKAPIQSVPVSLNTINQFRLRNGILGAMVGYPVSAYERSSLSSTIITNYVVVLKTADTITAPIPMSYDYRDPQTIYLKDNIGNTATVSPSHQVSGGITTDVSSVFFVDNGYGTYEAFDKVNFKIYLDKVNGEVQWANPLALDQLPQNWAQFLARMKTLGLVQFTDLPLRLSGTNNIIMTYPVGSVGTQLQAVIPKAMAKTITVVQNWGDPVIDSATLSPQSIAKGQGVATLTVKVTNKGTSDTINVNAVVNGATVTAVVNSMRLAQGAQGTFTFMVNPMVSISSDVSISVIATAGGSGFQDTRTVVLTVTVPTPGATTQRVIVKAYTPDGAILSSAPIIKNGLQAGKGSYDDTLPLGKYVFTTDNVSNPKLYAPTSQEVTLTGGEPKIVSLTFSTVPQGDIIDLTWLFWLVLVIVIVYIIYHFNIWKNPIFLALILNPTLWIGLAALWILWMIYNFIINFKIW